jgi:TatA/E family protein of Tat protein translocase
MGLDNPLHIAFLVVILLLVFGARRLPEIGRSLGSGMREFKDSITGDHQSHPQQQQPALPQAQAQPPAPAQQPPQQAAPVQAAPAQAAPAPPAPAPPTPEQAAPAPQQVPAEPTPQG